MNAAQIYAGYVERIDELEEENRQLRVQLRNPNAFKKPHGEKAIKVLAALAGINTMESAILRRDVIAKCEGMTHEEVSTTLSNLESQHHVLSTPSGNGKRVRFFLNPFHEDHTPPAIPGSPPPPPLIFTIPEFLRLKDHHE